jgi:hypothetical protein
MTAGSFAAIPIADFKPKRRPLLVIPTRISYFALLATTTCAALHKESRMQIIKATGLYRKSGGAQRRDLLMLTGLLVGGIKSNHIA